MIVKNIEIEMEFPDDFVPPEKFDGDKCCGKCWDCPFYVGFDNLSICVIGGENECPIKKYFDNCRRELTERKE